MSHRLFLRFLSKFSPGGPSKQCKSVAFIRGSSLASGIKVMKVNRAEHPSIDIKPIYENENRVHLAFYLSEERKKDSFNNGPKVFVNNSQLRLHKPPGPK